jgi:hypothetical protein
MPEDGEPRGSRPEVRPRPSKPEEAHPPVSTSVVRKVTLTLEEFGRTLLEAQARAREVPPATIVRRGALYFLAERGSERTATKIPRFASEPTQGGEELELAITLDEADWAALEEEAKRQHVSLERLLVHGALLLLAEEDEKEL